METEKVQSGGGGEIRDAILNRVRSLKRWHLSKALKKINGVSYVTSWRKSKGLRSECPQCVQGTTKMVRVGGREWARRRVGGDVWEIQARVGRILQVNVRIWPSRINKMVTIAVLGKGAAESDHSPSCSLCSENKHRQALQVSLYPPPLEASMSLWVTPDDLRTQPILAWEGWVRSGSPTAYVLNHTV